MITDLKLFIFGSLSSDSVFTAHEKSNFNFFIKKKHFLGLWRMHAATTENTKIIRTVLPGFNPTKVCNTNLYFSKGSVPDLYSDVEKWTDFLFGHLSKLLKK